MVLLVGETARGLASDAQAALGNRRCHENAKKC